MLTNNCGFPILEGNDLASPAVLRDLAEAADERLAAQELEIDYLERPEAAILTLTGNQDAVAYGTNIQSVFFDAFIYLSRPGVYAFSGINFDNSRWRPGIYHAGAYLEGLTIGAINSLRFDLKLYDRRGPKLLNEVNEGPRITDGVSARGAESFGLTQLFEVHDPSSANFAVEVNLVGAGTFRILTSSRMWVHRVRGLSDV